MLRVNPIYIDSGVFLTNTIFTPHAVFDLQEERIAAFKGSIFTSGFTSNINSSGTSCNIILLDIRLPVEIDLLKPLLRFKQSSIFPLYLSHLMKTAL